MTSWIYGLRDPRRPDEIRYVGHTIRPPTQRLRQHIYKARQGRRVPRCCWIRKLLKDGIVPEVVVLEVFDFVDWRDAERRWIATLRAEGHRLTNNTEGGESGPPGGGWKLSEETKAKMRKPKSAETRARMSAYRQANPRPPMSEETRAKLRAAHLGKPSPNKGGTGLVGTANGMWGRTHTAEARAVMSAARKRKGATWRGGKHTEETKARLRELALSRKVSEETKAKIAASMRQRHAERKALGLPWSVP